MTNVATDLLGKKVTVYEVPEWDPSTRGPRLIMTGTVRAVTFGAYHPPRTEPVFHLLVEKTDSTGYYHEFPVGSLLLARINGRTFVAIEHVPPGSAE